MPYVLRAWFVTAFGKHFYKDFPPDDDSLTDFIREALKVGTRLIGFASVPADIKEFTADEI